MKNDRHGQAAILDNTDYSKLRKQIKSQKYKILLDLAWYTGERWGALVKLQVEDVYNSDGSPRSEITFRACTRKASPDGQRKTRQVPVHDTLREILQNYHPESLPWLFPNREGDAPITLRWADQILRSAVERSGFEALGISTHSTRRSFITKLHRAGVDVYTIQKITGHHDVKALGRYIEIDADQVRGAIATL